MKRSLFFILALLLSVVMIGGSSACAAEVFQWQQSYQPSVRFDVGECKYNNAVIKFEAVAISDDVSSYDMWLEKRTWWGGWQKIGTAYRRNSSKNQTYDVGKGRYVMGSYVIGVWPVDKGNYQVVFANAKNPQQVAFTDVRVGLSR